MSKPTKESVRRWTDERWMKEPHKPLPDEKTLRRELGLDLNEVRRKEAEKKRSK